jgi:hypothetical protein
MAEDEAAPPTPVCQLGFCPPPKQGLWSKPSKPRACQRLVFFSLQSITD